MGSSLLLAHSHTHRSTAKKKNLLSMSGYFTALFRAADADANGLLEACELQDHLKIVDAVQANIKSQMAEKKRQNSPQNLLRHTFWLLWILSKIATTSKTSSPR